MDLTRSRRFMFALFGLGLLAFAGVSASLDWQATFAPAALIAAVVVMHPAFVGKVADINVREGKVEWPKNDPTPRIEALEAAAADLETRLGSLHDKSAEDLKALRAQISDVLTKLDDFILAHEPEPDDDMDDQERLIELEMTYRDTSREVDSRRYSGEDYDDGIGLDELVRGRDTLQADLQHEQRRQAAREKYAGHVPR